MVAGPTAEARTEAGLMGAVGDIHTEAALMGEAAGRVIPVAADRTSVRAGRAVEEAATFSEAAVGAAVDSAAVDRLAARRRWRGQAERDPLEAADTELVDTEAVRHALRADIHPARMAAVITAEQGTDTAVDTHLAEPATEIADTQETPVRTTRTAATIWRMKYSSIQPIPRPEWFRT